MTKQLLYNALYLLCFLGVSFLSCKKEPGNNNNSIPVENFSIPAPTPVNGSVSGRVVDENNLPIASTVVECAGATVYTDANGFFNINNVTLDKYISTLVVTRAGYFKAYRSFSANATRNFVNVKLIPKILTATVNSSLGGTVTLANTTEIKFQQNGMVIKSSGAVYNGTVNVFTAYIDPTSADISSIVPGSFMGRDDSNLYSLQSTGMIAVDIETPSGEPLQLAANMPATIKLLIPLSLRDKAPQTIDTWSLDDNGVWKKEGSATRINDQYEMQVTHFCFWNCDQPTASVYLNLHLQDQEGNSLVNASVTLTISPNSTGPVPLTTSGFAITDAEGNAAGLVPAGVPLTLSLQTHGCIQTFNTQTIGPFTQNEPTSVNISVNLNPAEELIIDGIANDCSGQPLQSGIALIYSGLQYVYSNISNGTYHASFIHCDPVSAVNVVLWNGDNSSQAILNAVAVSANSLTVPSTALCNIPLNIYDGIYNVTGSFTDVNNPGFSSLYPMQYHLITTGPGSVTVETLVNGELVPGYPFHNSPVTTTYYGYFGLQVSFSSSTNTISDLHNYYGDPNNIATSIGSPIGSTGPPTYTGPPTRYRRAVLDSTGLNFYDPVSRVIRIKYLLYDITTPVGPHAYFDETWTYTGPR